jgi:hypothetical protein
MLKQTFLLFVMAALLPAVSTRASIINDSFRGTDSGNWTFSGVLYQPVLTAASGIDIPGDGWLRLTSNGKNESAFAINNIVMPTHQGFSISFDYASYGGTGADGFCLALVDVGTETTVHSPGGYGGSLGY